MLLAASYVFYGWWDWHFLGLIFFSTLVDYVCGILLDRRQATDPNRYELSERARKRVLLASLICNLGLLGFFKYYNFFTESLASSVWVLLGYEFEPWFLEIAVPVGISFYTFQSLSYTIDIYRGKLSSRRSFLDFALFVAIFPQLVAGPIVRAKEMLPQIEEDRRFDLNKAQEGIWLILWGLVKKVVIADNIPGSRTRCTIQTCTTWVPHWPLRRRTHLRCRFIVTFLATPTLRGERLACSVLNCR